MINILKTIVNYVKPYKSNQIENEFTELNYQYWKKEDSSVSSVAENSYCLIEGRITCTSGRIKSDIQPSSGNVFDHIGLCSVSEIDTTPFAIKTLKPYQSPILNAKEM